MPRVECDPTDQTPSAFASTAGSSSVTDTAASTPCTGTRSSTSLWISYDIQLSKSGTGAATGQIEYNDGTGWVDAVLFATSPINPTVSEVGEVEIPLGDQDLSVVQIRAIATAVPGAGGGTASADVDVVGWSLSYFEGRRIFLIHELG